MRISDSQHRLFTAALYVLALGGAIFYTGKAAVALYNRYTTPTAQADIVNYNNWTASPYTQRVYGTATPVVRSDYSIKDSRINVSVVGQNPVIPGTWGVDYGRQTTRVSNDQPGYYNPTPYYAPTSYSPYMFASNNNYMPAGPVPPDYFNCFTGESIYCSDYCSSKYSAPPAPQYAPQYYPQQYPVWRPTPYYTEPYYQQAYQPNGYGYWR